MTTDSIAALNRHLQETAAGWEAGEYPADKPLRLGFETEPGDATLADRERIAAAKPEDTAAFLAARAPTAFDLRDVGGRNFVTRVKDQDDCGSCVSFAVVGAVESTWRVLKNDPALDVNLSEAHLFHCHGGSSGASCGNGWYVPRGLNAARSNGIVDEACYPYRPVSQGCGGLCADWRRRVSKITGWREVHSNADMKEWLSTRGSLVAAFTVYSDFFAYRRGVYRRSANAVNRGGHAVACIGYNDAGRYWICKNSWGTDWGEDGFFRIAYGQVGIDSYMWAVEGINGVDPSPGPVPDGWLKGKKINGLWATDLERTAWVHVDGIGWKRLAFRSDVTFYQLLTVAISAKETLRPVDILEKQGVITEIYAF